MKNLPGPIILSILLLGQMAACQNPAKGSAEEKTKADR
jgi:hypothetical protein